MRKRIYEVIEVSQGGDTASRIYDFIMMFAILLSLIPLCIKAQPSWAIATDKITVTIFILDYILRIITADYKLTHGKSSFVIYPFTPMAVIDLLSILPSFNLIGSGFRMLKLLRLFRTFKVFRVFKFARYSHSVEIIIDVLNSQREPLLAVCGLAAAYIVISALVVFNVEPDTFSNFFEAIYWATVSLTTVGYGDIYPVSTIGRIVTMVSSLFGIAIVALPAGIITAGYMDKIKNKEDE